MEMVGNFLKLLHNPVRGDDEVLHTVLLNREHISDIQSVTRIGIEWTVISMSSGKEYLVREKADTVVEFLRKQSSADLIGVKASNAFRDQY